MLEEVLKLEPGLEMEIIKQRSYIHFLLATDEERMTALHVVVRWGTLEIRLFQEVWELTKENVTTEETYNKILLATEEKRRTVLHVAAAYHERNVLQEIFDCAKGKLTTEEVKKELLAKHEGITEMPVAAEDQEEEILKEIIKWPKKKIKTFFPVSPPRPYTTLSSPIRATCPAHLILLDFITPSNFG